MKKLKHKKLILIFISVLIILSFIFLTKQNKVILTEGFTIDTNTVQYIESESNFKNINFNYIVKNDTNLEFKIYDPNGNLKDSGVISVDNPYNKEFKNIQGKWKVELISTNNKASIVESTTTKS